MIRAEMRIFGIKYSVDGMQENAPVVALRTKKRVGSEDA